MVIRSTDYPKSQMPGYHEGNGVFHIETLVSAEELGRSGRLFARGTLAHGDSVGMHAHNGNIEVCYFLQGEALVREGNGVEYHAYPGDTSIVPDGGSHEITSVGADDLKYLCVVLFPGGKQ